MSKVHLQGLSIDHGHPFFACDPWTSLSCCCAQRCRCLDSLGTCARTFVSPAFSRRPGAYSTGQAASRVTVLSQRSQELMRSIDRTLTSGTLFGAERAAGCMAYGLHCWHHSILGLHGRSVICQSTLLNDPGHSEQSMVYIPLCVYMLARLLLPVRIHGSLQLPDWLAAALRLSPACPCLTHAFPLPHTRILLPYTCISPAPHMHFPCHPRICDHGGDPSGHNGITQTPPGMRSLRTTLCFV